MQQLDKQLINSYFKKLGYHLQKIDKPWRFHTCILEKSGQKFFAKISSEKNLNEQLENEISWLKIMGRKKLPIAVPKVFKIGKIKGLAYFIEEFIEGAGLLGKESGSDPKDFLKNLDLIIETIIKIQKVKLKLTSKDKLKISDAQIQSNLWSIKNYLEQTKHQDLKVALSFAENLLRKDLNQIEIGTNHGDFVPWHILQTSKQRLFLIDPEHGQILGKKHYDAVYMFHRIWGSGQNKVLALNFLKQYVKSSKFKKRDFKQFEFLLARRIAGGYWEAIVQKWNELKPQRELLGLLVEGRLW